MEGLCQKFISSAADFLVVHSNSEIRALTSSTKLLVLDSSFNPPHLGHFNLVQRAIEHFEQHGQACSVLLQLSVNNADKAPQPASFPHRLEMMQIFAQDVQSQLGCDCLVTLTKHGKFLDKSESIKKALGRELHIVYLLGFDTLIRLFDPKYYKPLSVQEALADFMQNTEFYCLTRDCQNGEQLNWVKKCENIPNVWQEKIILEHNSDSNTNSISSSAIRDIVKKSPTSQELLKFLPGSIVNYLKLHESKNIF
ncbi:hypothetical protein ACO0QE_002283 [Hanseniaspora vineae]